jgi:hypothetical protein
VTSIHCFLWFREKQFLPLFFSAARNSADCYLRAVYLCKGFRRKLRCYSVAFGFLVNAVSKFAPFPTVRPCLLFAEISYKDVIFYSWDP